MYNTYMSEIIAQIGCYELRMNMVRMAQGYQTEANTKFYVDDIQKTRKGTHKSAM